jgi:hypothetical protein
MWSAAAVKTVASQSRKQVALAHILNLTWQGAVELAGLLH